MCGRFVSTSKPEDLVSLFGVTRWDPEETLAPSWNTAPTDPVWAVLERLDRDTGEIARQLRPLRWGLVPSWAKDPGAGARMINARFETVHEKPAFRKAFTARRCLLPADGYFEWVAIAATDGKKAYKQPYFIAPADGTLMAMAGLYEFWRDHTRPDDDPLAWLTTTTIITTDARDAAGRVHDRMPLAIDPADVDAWLDPEHTDPAELRQLLHTPAGGDLTVRPVSTAVNSVRNNGAQLLDEVPDPAPGGRRLVAKETVEGPDPPHLRAEHNQRSARAADEQGEAMDFDQVADELYALPAPQFTAAWNPRQSQAQRW